MNKVLAFSITSFFLGGIATLLFVNMIGYDMSHKLSDFSENEWDLHGTVWVQELSTQELKFSENDNSCYYVSIEQDISVPLTYTKVKNNLIFEPKNELTTLFLLSAFESFNVTGTLLENNVLIISSEKGISNL